MNQPLSASLISNFRSLGNFAKGSMGIHFNMLIGGPTHETRSISEAGDSIRGKTTSTKTIFLSHKTEDSANAEALGEFIYNTYRVWVYLTKWDDNVESDGVELPNYIMYQIRACNGLLVSVTTRISVSMWVGYEIGGAHAMQKNLARYMHDDLPTLPSVVAALPPLESYSDLGNWIRSLP